MKKIPFVVGLFFVFVNAWISATGHPSYYDQVGVENGENPYEERAGDQEETTKFSQCLDRPSRNSSRCQLGMAGRSVNNPALWYTVNTPVYPATVPLSIDRNNGFAKGKVELTPNGLLIGEAGDYSVTFSAILQNPIEEYTAVIPVFLSLNGQFNPLDPLQSSLGGVVTLPTGFINTVQGTGILHDVPAGTFLALIASNGGSPDPQPIRVVAWNISLFKIACDSPRCRPCR